MGKKRTLNMRRLTRKQVTELIGSGATLHAGYTARLMQEYSTGHKDQPQIYSLPNDRILYVFDDSPSMRGKGDIYPADYFDLFVRWTERVKEDYAHGRGWSTAHWAAYTAMGERLPAEASRLANELAEQVGATLDDSYEGLDRVSTFTDTLGTDRAIHEVYDHLVAYVGEVMKGRVGGQWAINRDSGSAYPYVEAGDGRTLMPINVVWEHLGGLDPKSLRDLAAQEVRVTAARHAPL